MVTNGMDTLSVVGIQDLQTHIEAPEAKHKDIRESNARIRLARPVLKTMGFSEDEIDAALVSDCRSDIHFCGRCALAYKFLRMNGRTLPAYFGNVDDA